MGARQTLQNTPSGRIYVNGRLFCGNSFTTLVEVCALLGVILVVERLAVKVEAHR